MPSGVKEVPCQFSLIVQVLPAWLIDRIAPIRPAAIFSAGTMLPAYAEYDYVKGWGSQGTVRVPTTLVVAVPLMLKKQTVVALAQNCIIDSTASLSAIVRREVGLL